MRVNSLLTLLLAILLACKNEPEQEKIDMTALQEELDSIYHLDQKYRTQMDSVFRAFGKDSEEMKSLLKSQNEIDSSNSLRILEIIDKLGEYPGASLFKSPGNQAAFFVIQHSHDSVKEKYYKMIVNAGISGELDKRSVAMFQDRVMLSRGEPQVYGTQIIIDRKTDSTGLSYDSTYLWPLKDTTNINKKRLLVGLGPLEEYLKQWGIEYLHPVDEEEDSVEYSK